MLILFKLLQQINFIIIIITAATITIINPSNFIDSDFCFLPIFRFIFSKFQELGQKHINFLIFYSIKELKL